MLSLTRPEPSRMVLDGCVDDVDEDDEEDDVTDCDAEGWFWK